MDVGLRVAVHPLRERDAAYKTKLTRWVVSYWVGCVDVWM